ncbi:MAG TPA: hypothetical protein P5016_03445 [Verrucomicrobiales bacterium]|nr:hypothetical protein [Verrucomicrobiales bacterium]
MGPFQMQLQCHQAKGPWSSVWTRSHRPGYHCFPGTDDSSLQGDTRLKRTRGGMVWCLDETTGKTLWRLPVPVRPKE